jgi:hypothetical protein
MAEQEQLDLPLRHREKFPYQALVPPKQQAQNPGQRILHLKVRIKLGAV